MPETPDIKPHDKILFLGDSITQHGHYTDLVKTTLLLNGHKGDIINLGLSSETVSGLSEEDQPFPRPYLHDRLEKILEYVKPDQIFICYGMNCGIYHPFSEERFQKYQEGILKIITESAEIGAQCTILTPPPYASEIHQPPHNPDLPYGYTNCSPDYNEVLQRYADWIMALNDIKTVNVRPLISSHLKECYRHEPVHPNNAGHCYLACSLLKALDLKQDFQSPSFLRVLGIVKQQRNVYDQALLNHLGHGNPSVLEQKTFCIKEAETENTILTEKLITLLSSIKKRISVKVSQDTNVI